MVASSADGGEGEWWCAKWRRRVRPALRLRRGVGGCRLRGGRRVRVGLGARDAQNGKGVCLNRKGLGFWWVLGQIGRVLGGNTHEAFSVPRLTVGVSNEVQMARNLTGSLPVVNQGRMTSLGPIRNCLIPTHERKVEMATGGERSTGMQNGQREKCSDA